MDSKDCLYVKWAASEAQSEARPTTRDRGHAANTRTGTQTLGGETIIHIADIQEQLPPVFQERRGGGFVAGKGGIGVGAWPPPFTEPENGVSPLLNKGLGNFQNRVIVIRLIPSHWKVRFPLLYGGPVIDLPGTLVKGLGQIDLVILIELLDSGLGSHIESATESPMNGIG